MRKRCTTVFSFTTDKTKGQSLDGGTLDVPLLDKRVKAWKTSLGLYHQENFPPENFPINQMGEKFHDRSHILAQDYWGKSSEDFQRIYKESSRPSIYEELLTFFCAQITHRPDGDFLSKVTPEGVAKKIDFLQYIGYVKEGSIFLTDKTKISSELSFVLTEATLSDDFPLFVQTLIFSSKDCPNWDKLQY